MTSQMIITLLVVIGMVVVIIMDKLPFGAPALIAATLLVVLGQTDIATAFSGFTDKNVILIMGFMVCTAAFMKTKATYSIKAMLFKLSSKGGRMGLLVLLLALYVAKNFITGTAQYILVITLIASIPYSKALPNSQILLPAVLAPAPTILPSGAAMMIGIAASLCEKSGYQADIPLSKYMLVGWVWSAIYLVYAIFMYKVLPDKDISQNANSEEKMDPNAPFVPVLKDWQQSVVYVLYAVLIIAMFFLSKLGDIGYALPLLIAGVYLAIGAIDFKTMLGTMFSPVMIMMASIIGVAATMANCGLSGYIGSLIAGAMGGSPSLFSLVLVFSLLTSLMATFTGASFGSLFVFAPIGISLCMSLGYSPVPLVMACTTAAWTNYIMPIDGMPALAMGTGQYKLTQFWKYTIPMYVIQIVLYAAMYTALFA